MTSVTRYTVSLILSLLSQWPQLAANSASGYPDALVGDAIPIEARVIAVGIFFEGVGPDAPDEELRRIAPGYPVFRLRDR
jgi:hypothetical protein